MSQHRKVTIADVARHVGMTNITVSRALNRPELVKPSTRERIVNAAMELGYVPNAFARGLKRSDSRLIGVVTASLDNPFYAEMIKAISKHAKQHDYSIMLFDTDGEPWLEATAIETLLSYQVAGIILSPVSDEPDYKPSYIERLQSSHVAVVELDRKLHDSEFSAVILDNRAAGELAGRYLLEHVFNADADHKAAPERLLVVAGPQHSCISRQRLAGVRNALAHRSEDIRIDVLWGDYTFQPAYEQVCDYLEHYGAPAAIFGLNQLITLGTLKALKRTGYSRQSLTVVGVDRLPYMDIFDITVPSVIHDGYLAGRRALELLLERIAAPNQPPRIETVRGEMES